MNLIPRNTIAKGTMYVSTNKPAGFFWTKPGMDNYILDDSPAMQKKNKESLTISKVIQMAIPDEWIYRYLKVAM